MTSRLAVLIVSIGLISFALLGLRQARLQAAHELASSMQRAGRIDDESIRVRAELVRRMGEALLIDPSDGRGGGAPAVRGEGADGAQDGARAGSRVIDLRGVMAPEPAGRAGVMGP